MPLDAPPYDEEEDVQEHRGRSRRSSSSQGWRIVLWLLGALLVAVGTVSLPQARFWLAVKAFAVQAVAIILAVYVVSRGDWTRDRVRAALTAPVNVAILLFMGWIGLSVALSSLRSFSQTDAMRHLGGALIYFSVVYGLSPRRQLPQFVWVLTLAGAASALLAFSNFGATGSWRLAGAFRNEQLLAGVLCVLFPVIVVASRTQEVEWQRVATQVAVVAVGAGILLARNRSVWAGTLIGAIVLTVLYLKYLREEGGGFQKHQLIVPLVTLVLCAGLFVAMSRSGGDIGLRAKTLLALGADTSVQWRRGMWDKAFRMAKDRPVFGWGIGTFPVNQALYYHKDVPQQMQLAIVVRGPNLSHNAHNTYLQFAADLGFTGLALYLGVFATYFGTGLRALRKMRPGFRKAVVAGALAGIAAQMVSGIGSPAWEFPQCSLFLWTVLGLGMAAAGVGERGKHAGESRFHE